MTVGGKWEDLSTRLISALVLAVVGFGLVVAGGVGMAILGVLAAGLMLWELARLSAPAKVTEALTVGVSAALTLGWVLIERIDNPLIFPLIAVVPIYLVARPRRDRVIAGAYGLAAMLAAYGAVAFREGIGLSFVMWLILVVIASDLLGYFGGRLLGGPKFWPAISPKKTWSGTLAGWLGAALVGYWFTSYIGAPGWLAAFSVLVAFAAQMGDIAESAIKRRAGAKDSSSILPGHGGVLDRFDGMIGAIVFLLAWGMALPVPVIGG